MWCILGLLMWFFDSKNEREGFEIDRRKEERKNRLGNAPIIGKRR